MGDSVKNRFKIKKICVVVCAVQDGRLLVIYNHSFKQGVAGCGILAAALSADDGQTWHKVLTLEDSAGRVHEYSSPALIQVTHFWSHDDSQTWHKARKDSTGRTTGCLKP
jgi:hypothetical protein